MISDISASSGKRLIFAMASCLMALARSQAPAWECGNGSCAKPDLLDLQTQAPNLQAFLRCLSARHSRRNLGGNKQPHPTLCRRPRHFGQAGRRARNACERLRRKGATKSAYALRLCFVCPVVSYFFDTRFGGIDLMAGYLLVISNNLLKMIAFRHYFPKIPNRIEFGDRADGAGRIVLAHRDKVADAKNACGTQHR